MVEGKTFWSRVAGVYERSVLAGKHAGEAYQEMIDSITRYIEPDMTVLELAAGPGLLSRQIAPHCKTLVATDYSPKMVRAACRKKVPRNCIYMEQDATNLLFTNGKFDAVVIANALHIMPHPEKALSEISRVLKEDGILIAPTFIRESGKYYPTEVMMQQVGFHTYHRWTKEEFEDYVADQGFRVTRNQLITGHNFPISFLVARKELA